MAQIQEAYGKNWNPQKTDMVSGFVQEHMVDPCVCECIVPCSIIFRHSSSVEPVVCKEHLGIEALADQIGTCQCELRMELSIYSSACSFRLAEHCSAQVISFLPDGYVHKLPFRHSYFQSTVKAMRVLKGHNSSSVYLVL